MIPRRKFLTTTTGAMAMPILHRANAAPSRRKPRIAFLGSSVYRHSHAQHFLDRLTVGYTWAGKWRAPSVEVAGVYIDQFPGDRDLARHRIAKHKLRQFPTIAEALTLGGNQLAVDGVVIIAEHGDYPKNELGQKLYPRYRWFKEVVKVFEDSGRSVPVFNDKHLSTDWDECVEMVADSQRLGFAFLAGSSLPVTWRHPSIDMPYNADLQESVCVAYGGPDSYDIHALETAQCMSERRRGGEVGIESVHAVRGDKVWEILDRDDRKVTRELAVSAMTRSHSYPVEGGFPVTRIDYEWFRKTNPKPLAYFIEHRDGFRTSMFMTRINDFNYAGRLRDGSTVSCQMYLPMPGRGSSMADFFNPLTGHIEDTILNRRAPYPVERTLLTSGMVIAGVKSLHAGEVPVATPQMKVKYQGPKKSNYWRV